MEKIFHETENHKAAVAKVVLDKIDFKINTITLDKKGHYIMIQGSIQQDIKL